MNLLIAVTPFVRMVDRVTFHAFWCFMMLLMLDMLAVMALEVFDHSLDDRTQRIGLRIAVALLGAAALCMIVGVSNNLLFYP